MTHEETSFRTKKALSSALKELMIKHKSFSKVTVSELIKTCNVNRKTFYYHFEDIYALFRWTLEQEAIVIVSQFDLLVDYREAFLFLIDYVAQNSFFLACMYDSIGRDEMKRFFYRDFIGFTQKLITDTATSLGLTVPHDTIVFLSEFYMGGLADILIELFQNPDGFNREKLLEHLALIFHYAVPAVLKQSAEKPGNSVV